jgi:hypothetical protein
MLWSLIFRVQPWPTYRLHALSNDLDTFSYLQCRYLATLGCHSKRRTTTLVTSRYCCSCNTPAGAVDVDCVHCAHRLCKCCELVTEETFYLDLMYADTEQGSHKNADNCTTQKRRQHPIPTQRRSQLSNDQRSDNLTVETIRGYGKVQESGARQTRNLEETRALSTERQCAPLVIQEVKKRRLNMVKCENCRRDKKRVMNPPLLACVLRYHY